MRAKAVAICPSSLVALTLGALVTHPALGAPGDPTGLQILDSDQGALLSISDSGVPVGFAYQLGLPLAYESQQLGEPVLAIGPIASIESDGTAVRVASTDIFLMPSPVITTADGNPLPRDVLKVGDVIAVGGDTLGGDAGIGRRVVLVGSPFVPGATFTYMRSFAGSEGETASALSATFASAGWFEVVCATDSINGSCTPVVASPLSTDNLGPAGSEGAKGISGSGIRAKGISGSGIRAKGISGSGIRAKGISGSGIRAKGISGSGIRAKGISGSGIRAKGISGSGIRAKGISGSGIRAKAADSSRAD
jgi:hypothetical protein